MGFLKRLFIGSPAPIATFTDPALGVLTLEEEVWKKATVVDGHRVWLSVGGDQGPHPRLLEAAARGEAELGTLLGQLPSLLQGAAAAMPTLAGEISSLTVEEVSWWWKKDPDVAMVWFKGGMAGRVWHATYENRTLKLLVYDD